MKTRTNIANVIGKKYAKLTIVSAEGIGKYGYKLVKARCDCGGEIICKFNSIERGRRTTCGCLQKAVTATRSTTHGLCKRGETHPLYTTYNNMKKRCYDTEDKFFACYGGRGITVCERWRNDFAAFLIDMGEKPAKNCSLERINNNGNYEPSNVKWGTPTEQARNKSNTLFLTFNGKKLALMEWSEKTGIPYHTLRARKRLGWSDEKVLTYS